MKEGIENVTRKLQCLKRRKRAEYNQLTQKKLAFLSYSSLKVMFKQHKINAHFRLSIQLSFYTQQQQPDNDDDHDVDYYLNGLSENTSSRQKAFKQ